MTPIALGNSGHRSLTSKTNGLLRNQRAKIPGIPAVSGVVVAKTRSYLLVRATPMLRMANFRKLAARLSKPSLLA
ncbi:hypothetical protein D3C79_988720 [compost metagenome]